MPGCSGPKLLIHPNFLSLTLIPTLSLTLTLTLILTLTLTLTLILTLTLTFTLILTRPGASFRTLLSASGLQQLHARGLLDKAEYEASLPAPP